MTPKNRPNIFLNTRFDCETSINLRCLTWATSLLSTFNSILFILRHPLFNNDLLSEIFHSSVSWSCCGSRGQAVSSHIFFVSLPNDPKGLYISVRNVRDGVSIERRLMGNGADLLNRNARSWGLRKAALEGFIIAECNVGTGAFGSSWWQSIYRRSIGGLDTR